MVQRRAFEEALTGASSSFALRNCCLHVCFSLAEHNEHIAACKLADR